MGHRGGLAGAFRSKASVEFAFLVEEAGFTGPEHTDEGLLFHSDSAGLDMAVWFRDGHEPLVTTLLAPIAADGVRSGERGWTTG